MSVYLYLQDVHIGYNTSQSFPFINLLFSFNDFFVKLTLKKGLSHSVFRVNLKSVFV